MAASGQGDDADLSVVVFQNGPQLVNFQIHGETQEIWATTRDIAQLYGVDDQTISYHINNIFSDGELHPEATTQDFQVVRNEGVRHVRRIISHYNMDMIISIGYRVNAKQAISFRQWATQTLKHTLNKVMLLMALRESPEKVNELAAKVRAIRSEEKQVYAKVRDCFKISSSDYDPKSQEPSISTSRAGAELHLQQYRQSYRRRRCKAGAVLRTGRGGITHLALQRAWQTMERQIRGGQAAAYWAEVAGYVNRVDHFCFCPAALFRAETHSWPPSA